MNQNIVAATGILVVAAFIGAGWWLHRSTVEAGRALAEENCADCHDLTETKNNEDAPHLWGVVNRRAGSVAGFAYSEAFQDFVSGRQFSWTEANLDLLIADPNQLIPGTRMAEDDTEHAKAFRNMQDLDQRRGLIAYLRTLE